MADNDIVAIPAVRAISDGLALICELPDGRRIGVPKALIDPTSEVRRPGDYGTLFIPIALARDLGIGDGDGA